MYVCIFYCALCITITPVEYSQLKEKLEFAGQVH